uniref:G-patch domain-containing protein n=1 Tax=Chelonoidis abingdonii TaxID=106734 RepID=A0A8C0G5L8_CHEAB
EPPNRSRSSRSKSSERHESRSKSDEVEVEEPSQRSRSSRSKSSERHKSRSKSDEKIEVEEPSQRSRSSRSKSPELQKSRSKSAEKTKDKVSSQRSRRKRSKSSQRHKSRSKSVEKVEGKASSQRSRSKRSKSSERKLQKHDSESRSRRNRSRSVTRKRLSKSKSNHRSRTRSLSRSRHRRRTRSRSVSKRRRSLSRERHKRSQRNRSRSADRRRRRSNSRDHRIVLRLRTRSRTPIRRKRSRSVGRRRSSSKSPVRLRRSRSPGRRRCYSRSPDRQRRSRSSDKFSSRSPKRLTDLDKAQLLEIAKANAAAMCAKAGVPLPPSLLPIIAPAKKEEKVTQKSARDTIKELTEKCKKIAQSTDDVIVNKPHDSDEEEEERPFYNHPFKLNEPKPIFFNLNTTPIVKPAPKNQVTLTKEFPVSSGSQHRKKEADSVYGEWVPVEKSKEESKDDVFPKPALAQTVDISTAMNERTMAQKRLTENTFDLEAMCLLNRAQEQIDAWAQSNSLPGQFTGSTGAQILSSDELSNSGPQAWIRKDQFLRAAPVTGGMGAQLMRKMGWREGEGLGKNREGTVEPILVDFKTDRKGLVAVGEKTQKRSGHFSVMKDLSGKAFFF